LTIVSEVGFYPVLEVHDAFGVHFAGCLGAIWEFHLPDLGSEDVAEVAVEGGGTTRVSGSSCALGDGEGLLFFDFVGDQIDGATTAIDNEDGVVYLEVEQTGL